MTDQLFGAAPASSRTFLPSRTSATTFSNHFPASPWYCGSGPWASTPSPRSVANALTMSTCKSFNGSAASCRARSAPNDFGAAGSVLGQSRRASRSFNRSSNVAAFEGAATHRQYRGGDTCQHTMHTLINEKTAASRKGYGRAADTPTMLDGVAVQTPPPSLSTFRLFPSTFRLVNRGTMFLYIFLTRPSLSFSQRARVFAAKDVSDSGNHRGQVEFRVCVGFLGRPRLRDDGATLDPRRHKQRWDSDAKTGELEVCFTESATSSTKRMSCQARRERLESVLREA